MIINWQLESKYLITNHKNIQSIKTIFGFTDSFGSSGDDLVCDLYAKSTEFAENRDFTEFGNFLLRKMGIKMKLLDTLDGLVPRPTIT